jgi:choline-glycine betaine transporter
MSVFAGTALIYQQRDIADLVLNLEQQGPESLIYVVMNTFPGGFWISILFFIAVFISFVTAADSTTIAMGALSTKGLAPENPDPPSVMKILWGVLVGAVSLIMVGFAGINGIKMLSTIGGFPISIVMIAVAVAAIYLAMKSFQKESRNLHKDSPEPHKTD